MAELSIAGEQIKTRCIQHKVADPHQGIPVELFGPFFLLRVEHPGTADHEIGHSAAKGASRPAKSHLCTSSHGRNSCPVKQQEGYQKINAGGQHGCCLRFCKSDHICHNLHSTMPCKTILEYKPANMSSIITPQPPFSSSIFRIPRGFAISKNRNKTRPHSIYCHRTGTNSRVRHIPATSSMTTLELSFPHPASTFPALHTPIARINPVTSTGPNVDKLLPLPPVRVQYKAIQNTMAARVPPPFGVYPIPKQVEMSRWNFSIIRPLLLLPHR